MNTKIIYTVFLLFPVFYMSCNDNNQGAKGQYGAAESFYEQGNYESAKREIDSISILYPKAYDEIKAGMQLMRKVQLKEYERNLSFADSLMTVREKDVETLKKDFIFEKDKDYQTIGNYIYKAQKLEKNLERSYLRAQVDEQGVLQLASVYFGATPINHSSIRVDGADGIFAESAVIPYDGGINYRFKDNGNTTEVVTYRGDKGLSVADFINTYNKNRIKLTYQGGRKQSIYLDEPTKKAVIASYQLSVALSDIERLKKEKAIAIKGIEISKQRIAQKANTATSEK